MFAGLEREVEAVPGVSAMLDMLIAAGIKIAVGSNGPRAKMDITLRRTGLMERLYPHIYSARDLARPKPAPDVYTICRAAVGGVARCMCRGGRQRLGRTGGGGGGNALYRLRAQPHTRRSGRQTGTLLRCRDRGYVDASPSPWSLSDLLQQSN